MQIVIKAADVSNEARPPEVSLPWMRRLFEEFGKQYDREVEVGVKETPFMNSKTVSKPSAQIGFIKYAHNLHAFRSSVINLLLYLVCFYVQLFVTNRDSYIHVSRLKPGFHYPS